MAAPRIPERLASKRVGVPLAVQRRPAKKNLFCINTSLDSLKALLSPLPPLPMQIRLLHAHAINPRRATYAHRLRALRWGIEARTPPPPPPHQHPRLPGALKAAAGLQPSPSMTFSHRLAWERKSCGRWGREVRSCEKSCQCWEVRRAEGGGAMERHPSNVACAAANLAQVPMWRMRVCVHGKKSRAGSIASGRTIKKSRRGCAT